MESFGRHFKGFDTVIPTHLGTEGEVRQLLFRFVVEDVSYEFHGGDRPEVPCTARLSVRTSTHYSLLASASSRAGEAGQTGAARGVPTGAVVSGASARSAGTGGRKKPKKDGKPARPNRSRSTVDRPFLQPATERRTDTYDFAYEDHRWVLKTPRDKIEKSVKTAIEFSLEHQ